MPTLRSVVLVSLSIIQFSALAVPPPALPPAGEDKVLTSEFLRKHTADASCQAELVQAKDRLSIEEKKLAALVSDHAPARDLDEQEEIAKKAREGMLSLMEKCGECATRIEYPYVLAPITVHRVEAFGACQLAGGDSKKFREIYESARKLLLHVKTYPRQLGGFDDILEFMAVDNNSGELLPDVDEVLSSPFFSVIAIRGPAFRAFNKLIRTAFIYYAENDFTEKRQRAFSEFHVTIKTTKHPAGFSLPKVYEFLADGKKSPVTAIELKSLVASWYLRSDGYFRYSTAGDFPQDMREAGELARRIMLGTVSRLKARAAQEVGVRE